MTITLTPEIESIVKQKVASGYYASETAVIRESLRLLQQRDEEKLKSLREDLQAAYEQSARGESTPLDMETVITEETVLFEQRQKEKLNGETN